jgi:hypothetical protein
VIRKKDSSEKRSQIIAFVASTFNQTGKYVVSRKKKKKILKKKGRMVSNY